MSYNQMIAAKRRRKVERLGPRMLKLLEKYVSDDPCAPNDPRFIEAQLLISLIEEENHGKHSTCKN